MIVPQTFAALFARTLDLFRDPAAKEDQKVQFRALLALLKIDAVTLATGGGQIVVNGTPVPAEAYGALLQRLELYAVERIVLPADPAPSQVFELLKALAEQPGQDDIPTRLRAAGADGITVVVSAPPELDLGADGILHGVMGDVAVVSQGPPAPPLAPLAQEAGGGSAAFAPASAVSRPSTELLAELQRRPTAPQVGDLLAVLGRQLESALRANRVEQASTIIAGIVRAEQQLGGGGGGGGADESRRRQYSIALKRMYTKSLLEGIAALVAVPSQRDDALLALQRAGADGVEVLLDLLVTAPTIEERRGLFAALTAMREGTDQLVHMLGHHEWFVVRNVAELVGELALEDAVPALGRQLDHEDERVRKAVALALAKIGSRAAAEPLRRALRDPAPEVRMQAALGVGGRKSSALAMPLVVAMGEEKDETVERELMLALGRIGSADAVQALIKFAQPGGKLFGRKPTALRVTAVEALRLAATPAAVGTLEGLAADGDKQVRAAAQAALGDLKRK